MIILPRTDVLAAKDMLFDQLKTGALSADDYEIAFAKLNAAHSHNQRCANGDHRPVIVIIGGRPLCGVCAIRAHEVQA